MLVDADKGAPELNPTDPDLLYGEYETRKRLGAEPVPRERARDLVGRMGMIERSQEPPN